MATHSAPCFSLAGLVLLSAETTAPALDCKDVGSGVAEPIRAAGVAVMGSAGELVRVVDVDTQVFDVHFSVNAHVSPHVSGNPWHVDDAHIDLAWEVDRAAATVHRAEECSAVSADVSVVPGLREPQPFEVFLHSFAVAEDVSAVETRIAGSVLINGYCSDAQCDKHGGGRVETTAHIDEMKGGGSSNAEDF